MDAAKAKLTVILTLSHPGVLKHHQVVEDEGLIYVVTDRHDKTLEHLLTEHKRRKTLVPITMILSSVKQLAAALAYLHGLSVGGTRGLVHRDFRPANIFINADDEHFIIADFGLCKDALWSGSTLIGIMAYMAPEALLHNEASPASDVWSLGVIVYELATLRKPDFLEGKDPAEVFVDGWKPDLSSVINIFIQNVLERIFVLNPKERLIAGELYELLVTFNVPVDELRSRCEALGDKCSALEAALNSANASIALLKDELKVKSDKITAALEAALESRPSEADALGQEPRLKTTRIDALEDQCKEHLAMIKALEDKLAQSSSGMNTSSSQIDFSALPQLIYAAHTNDMKTVQASVKKKLNIGQRDERGMTALMHAAQQGHVGPVELLVEKQKGLKDKNGWTALVHAAHENHPEVIEILVPHEHGKRNKNKRTALMIAAENGSAEAASVLALHEKGLINKEGKTALMIAAQEGHAEVASVLAPYEKELIDRKGNTALIIAAEAGHEDVVEVIDPTDDRGVTALMRAAEKNNTKTVCALIPFQKGHFALNGTALMRAAMRGHAETVQLLVKHEGRMKDYYYMSALMHSAAAGHLEATRLLLDRESGMRNACGMTALACAAANGHLKIVELLLEKERHLINKSDAYFIGMLNTNGYLEIASLLMDSTPGVGGYHDHQAAP